MKKQYSIGIFALFAIALLGVGLVSAFGMGHGKMLNLTDEEKLEMQTFQENLQQAIEAGDYNTWKALMESKLTETEFAKMQERHSEMKANQAERQQNFGSENFQKGQGSGMHKGMKGTGECPFAE